MRPDKRTEKNLCTALSALLLRPVGTLQEFFKKADVLLLVLCLVASVMGLALIYSSTRYDPALHNMVLKQGMFIVLGVAVYIWMSFVDIQFLIEKWWWVFLVLGVVVILLIAPFGREDNTGNRSWVYLPGAPIGFQPGEIAKLSFIVLLAWLMNRERPLGIGRFSALLRYGALVCLFAGLLVVLSGDFGMVLVYLAIFIIMTWVGGLSKWWFIGLGSVGCSGIVFLWNFIFPRIDRLWNDYRIMRFRVVFDHSLDPLGAGWQQSRSLIAIGSGQLTGLGYLQGRQTQSSSSASLPARHTDFIFSVCGEEFGLLGCCLVLAVLLAIILRCAWVSRQAKDHMSAYISMGIAGMLMAQTIINVGMCLYVMPVIGLTLPFFSYGGSSTLTLFIAMGIVSGIKMRPLPSWLKDRNQR